MGELEVTSDLTAAFQAERARMMEESGRDISPAEICRGFNYQYENTGTRLQSIEVTAGPEVAKLGLVFENVPPARLLVKEIELGFWAAHNDIMPGLLRLSRGASA